MSSRPHIDTMSAWPKTVAIACDHAAPELKHLFVDELKAHGCAVTDYGVAEKSESVDYPTMALKVAQAVAANEVERGVVLCGSGIGVSIAANKVHGIRCALCHDHLTAQLSRQHNDANVLAVGARTTGPEVAIDMLRVWMETPFEGGRHSRRIALIKDIEEGK